MSDHLAPAAQVPIPQEESTLSVEDSILVLKNAPQFPNPHHVPENAKVGVKAYDQLGIAIIAYFFKWLFNKELTVQADNGHWYVVSTSRLENYLRQADKISHANEAAGLSSQTIKTWLQETKRKANLIHSRIQRKFAKATEERQRAAQNTPESIEHVFERQPPPRGIDKLMFAYATVPPAVQTDVEAALRAAAGDVMNENVQIALLSQNDGNYGHAFETLDLHDINLPGLQPRATIETLRAKIELIAQVFPNLKELNLENCSLGGNSFTAVAEKFKYLEKLNINRNYNVQFRRIDPQSNPFPQLKELSMNDSGFTDTDLTYIPVLPKVEKLAIQGGANHDTHFTLPLPLLAERFPNLTHLDLSHSITLRFENLLELEKLPMLTLLDIRACPGISADQVALLRQANPDLQILHP